MPLLFSGRTAIITGAGGSLGRAYALELAKRGCQIVVNDIGGCLAGGVVDNSKTGNPATAVVQEIVSKGGKAIANYDDVLKAENIVQQALSAFGSCDILINNAGNLRDSAFSRMEKVDWDAVMGVHLDGTYAMCDAVWSSMQENKYGRIVNIGSGAGLYGNFGQANYSAAKMGIFGLSQTLAKEGERSNIMVNCVVPVAESRINPVMNAEVKKLLNPHHVTPLVTYLAHDTSKTTGGCYEVGGGWYSKVRFQRSAGVSLAEDGQACTAEEIQSRLTDIDDFSDSRQPPSYPTAASDAITEIIHQHGAEEKHKPNKADDIVKSMKEDQSKSTSSESDVKSDAFFLSIRNLILTDTAKWMKISQEVKAKILFEIDTANVADLNKYDKSTCKYWLVDCSPVDPSIDLIEDGHTVDFSAPALKPKVTITVSDETLVELTSGRLSPEYAYLRGKMKIRGQINTALKLKSLLEMLN